MAGFAAVVDGGHRERRLDVRDQAEVVKADGQLASMIALTNQMLAEMQGQQQESGSGTIDFGTGVRLYSSPHNALMLGYRYQHFSNANISVHNPGTDADTFYVGYSGFHTHGVR